MTGCDECGVTAEDDCSMDCPSRGLTPSVPAVVLRYMNETTTRKSSRGYTDHGGRLSRKDGLVEAIRYCRSEGASFSGWVVRSTYDPHSYSDPILTKAEATEALLTWDTSDVTVDADGTIRKA